MEDMDQEQAAWSIDDFDWVSEIHLKATRREEAGEEVIDTVAEVALFGEHWQSQLQYELKLRFEGVRDVLIRDCPGPVDIESFGLYDMHYLISKYGVDSDKIMRLLDYAERYMEERFRFGDAERDEHTNLSFYAKSVEIVDIRVINEQADPCE